MAERNKFDAWLIRWSRALGWAGFMCALSAVAFLLPAAFRREEAPFALLVFIGGLFLVASAIGGEILSALGRFLAPPGAGFKWDYVLLPVAFVVAWRYGAHLYSKGFDWPRSILWVMGFTALIASWRMVKDERAKAKAETGEPKAVDWKKDFDRYVGPLTLYALGLTL